MTEITHIYKEAHDKFDNFLNQYNFKLLLWLTFLVPKRNNLFFIAIR